MTVGWVIQMDRTAREPMQAPSVRLALTMDELAYLVGLLTTEHQCGFLNGGPGLSLLEKAADALWRQ